MTGGLTGVVLAGGRSTRMGRDKASLVYGGRPLLCRAVDLLRPLTTEQIVVGDPARHGSLHPGVVADEVAGWGPLGGLITAMGMATEARLLVLACDLPGLTPGFLADLCADHRPGDDVLVPVHGDGRREPLCAIYAARCRKTFLERARAGQLSLLAAIASVHSRDFPVRSEHGHLPAALFRNLNSPADL